MLHEILGLGVPGALAGYMPQYPTLHNFFTPREILAYYGRIFGVDNIQAKISQLLGMLQGRDSSALVLSNRFINDPLKVGQSFGTKIGQNTPNC